MSEDRRLAEGLAALGIVVAEATRAKLLAYCALLNKWNRVYNLTAIRSPDQVLTHHLLDSLAVWPHLQGIVRLADVGSGGGLPGIPLAIVAAELAPALSIVSVETVGKKASFQQQARIELGLSNFTVENTRVEQLEPAEPFDAVISRAFAELADFVRLAGALCPPGARLLAMKGQYPADEIARLPAGWRVVSAQPLTVPGLDAERHLITLERS